MTPPDTSETLDLRAGANTGAASKRLPPEFVGSIWEEMRAAWQQGRPFPAEHFLTPEFLAACSDEEAIDVIYGEFALAEIHGQKPRASSFLARFPQFASGLAKQLSLHAAIELLPDETRQAPRVAAPANLVCPGSFGKYLLVALLDSGGQSEVYRAVHPDLVKEVVLKIARKTGGSLDSQHGASLAAEARILAGLSHPNLAQVYDAGVVDGRTYLAMEYVRGRSLAQHARQTLITKEQAATIVAKTARALAVVHAAGILHLDIKPKNIVIDEQGEPRLIDFGLARHEHAWSPPATDEGLAGTLEFMAPEQANCQTDRLGPATDVFSLGGVLYYLLTNSPLFAGANARESLSLAQRCEWNREELASCNAPPALQQCCEQALACEPAARFGSAREFADRLEQCFAPEPKKVPRIGVWATLAGLALLIGAVVAGSGLFNADPAPLAVAPELQIHVWQEGIRKDLSQAVPLINGDELRVEASIPGSFAAAIFLINSSGQLQILKTALPSKQGSTLIFPNAESAAPLTGKPGTEAVMVVSGPKLPPSEAFSAWWIETAGPWPALAEYSILRVTSKGVATEQSGRDLGPAVSKSDPESEVRDRLERFRQILLKQGLQVNGLTFCHAL